MYNLVALFIRYSGVITFLVFESIALFWAVRYNERQHEIYVTSANVATGVLYKRYEQISNYFSLSNINDSLAKENAKLLSQLEQSKFERSIQRDTIQDVEEKLQLYSYIAANAIDNSINSREITSPLMSARHKAYTKVWALSVKMVWLVLSKPYRKIFRKCYQYSIANVISVHRCAVPDSSAIWFGTAKAHIKLR